MNVLRIVAILSACVVAPVVAVAAGGVIYFFDLTPDYLMGWDGAALIGGYLGILYGIPTMILLGLPVHVQLQRSGSTGPAGYAIAGTLAGVFSSIVFLLTMPGFTWPPSSSDWYGIGKVLAVGALTGALAAWIFWGLWLVRHRSTNPRTSAS